MRYLIFAIYVSFLFSEDVKLSLFLFDDVKNCDIVEKESQKVENPIKIYQGDFASNVLEKVHQLEEMKVDATLFNKVFLEKKISLKNLHLLTSNVISLEDKPVSNLWITSIDNMRIGFFGLNQFRLLPPKSFSFCCMDLFFTAKQKVKYLKNTGVDFIVLLCSLSEKEILSLLKKVEGIDLILSNKKGDRLPFYEKNTLIYFQKDTSRLDLLIEKKPMAQGSKVEYYPTWRKI